jgi:hypothetical protein
MYRPWVGAKKDEATMIQADLQIGIIGTATSNRDGSRWLSLRLKNFQKPTSEGMPGMGIEVGRPISEHTTFGTDMMYEAYRSLTSRALVLGEETLKYEIEVDATSLGAFPLPMSGNLRLPIERQPAYLLGSTCLLAAERTNRPVEVV